MFFLSIQTFKKLRREYNTVIQSVEITFIYKNIQTSILYQWVKRKNSTKSTDDQNHSILEDML